MIPAIGYRADRRAGRRRLRPGAVRDRHCAGRRRGGATAPALAPTPSGPVLPPIYSNLRRPGPGLRVRPPALQGDVRVEFNLARAEDPHNLWLVREDGAGSAYSFDEEPPGAVVAETVALTRGRWKLFCSLDGHEAASMRATLTVD